MDELSWRARLAKSNINVTNIDYKHWVIYFDFAYRPYSGVSQKWAKTFAWVEIIEDAVDMEKVADQLRDIVTELRKELEG